ncbi:hypothetical protein AB4Y43_16850 [Paraburkholderia sp. BR10872]|uniref:hypothetical protein n=1 Tax=Paraburkholderia sp. BR10872 TaxID=3236989 RepID=UPI0034D34BFB
MTNAAAVLRAVARRGDKVFEIASFTEPTNPDTRAVLTGVIELVQGKGRERVTAFVNDRKGQPGTFISLSARRVDDHSGEIKYVTVALGNVVNARADGSDVYYDTVLFNPVGDTGEPLPGAQPVAVYVTRACSPVLHARLGFAASRVERPARAAVAEHGVPGNGGGTDFGDDDVPY